MHCLFMLMVRAKGRFGEGLGISQPARLNWTVIDPLVFHELADMYNLFTTSSSSLSTESFFQRADILNRLHRVIALFCTLARCPRKNDSSGMGRGTGTFIFPVNLVKEWSIGILQCATSSIVVFDPFTVIASAARSRFIVGVLQFFATVLHCGHEKVDLEYVSRPAKLPNLSSGASGFAVLDFMRNYLYFSFLHIGGEVLHLTTWHC